MPLAKAALMADVTTRVPTTHASFVPPCPATNETARRPGGSCAPETIAASVSAMWCFVFSTTAPGSGRRRAAAM